ncbi:hypothetical protein SNEBB_002158 [Seison nebaliae]|nr:hypothetical protein SNEBB_002158 [Seison nebaliae]
MNQVAIVTGGNKGLGYAIVDLLRKDFDGVVYLTSRDEIRGNEALKKMGSPANVQWMKLDVSDDKSINEFYESIIKKHPDGIDILINNAGIAYKNASTASIMEQAQETLKTNYFGLTKVCLKFIDNFRPNSHLINVAGQLGMLCKIPGKELRGKLSNKNASIKTIDNLMGDFLNSTEKGKNVEEGWGEGSYNVSKVGVIAFTKALQRFVDENKKNIFVAACCPGYLITDMSSNKGKVKPEDGADTPVYLSKLSQFASEEKGQFWFQRKVLDWENGSVNL